MKWHHLSLFIASTILVFSEIHAETDTNCDLKSIFKIPKRRNYDEFEILERSNFDADNQAASTNPNKIEANIDNLPNYKFLLKLGDYQNAIRKNNNNVNTRITLGAPYNNNYYHVVSPQIGYPWTSQISPHYYMVNRPNYLSQYQILNHHPPRYIQRPIYLDPNSPVLQRLPSIHSNGLNTMTLIPKILMDSVAQNREVVIDKVAENINTNETVPTVVVEEEEVKIEPKEPIQPPAKETPNELDENITENIPETTTLAPTESPNQNGEESNKNEENVGIHNVDHPRVLHPVELSNNIENVEIMGAGSLDINMSGSNQQEVVTNCTNSEDLELVNLLQKSLVPFINLKTKEEPKLLVSYPVINSVHGNLPEHPSAIIVQAINQPKFCPNCATGNGKRRPNVDIDDLNLIKPFTNNFGNSPNTQTVVSGYEISSASGFYEDPTKRVVYNKPTEVTIVPPQRVNYGFSQPLIAAPEPPQTQVERQSKMFELFKQFLNEFEQKERQLTTHQGYNVGNPTIVRCPHCFKYHHVNGDLVEPKHHPHWHLVASSSACPYCAKYKGELNQLETN